MTGATETVQYIASTTRGLIESSLPLFNLAVGLFLACFGGMVLSFLIMEAVKKFTNWDKGSRFR